MPTAASTMTVSPEAFISACRQHPAGVAFLTASVGGVHAAMTVSSLSSVSVDPPLLVYSVSDRSSSAAVFNEAQTVVIHMLDSESLWLAKLGATSGIDRFANTAKWAVLPSGEPYFPGPRSVIRARVAERVRVGASTVCIAEALELIGPLADEPARPLVYHDRTWHCLNTSSIAREMTWLTSLGLTDDLEL